MKQLTVKISQIQNLLNQGKTVYVQSSGNKFQKITNYIHKGTLKTYNVKLSNGYQINVSKEHMFFEKSLGWVMYKSLDMNRQNYLLCDDGNYYKIISTKCIGFKKIVDITVDNQHCYFGNGIMNHNSGKSLVCAHLIKSCQEMGGIPVLIDTQAAANWKFMQAIGVDLDKLIFYDDLTTTQKLYSVIQQLMFSVKENMPDTPLLIIVDSLTAITTQADLKNTTYQNKGYNAGIKAKMNSQALRKLAVMAKQQKVALVFTSQVRFKVGQTLNLYDDKYKSSSGGMALQFYASLRIRLKKAGKIKEKVHGIDTVVGVRTKASIQKSRLGATNRDCKFDVYYDSGIDNYSNWIETLKKYSVLQGKGTISSPHRVVFEDYDIEIGNKSKQKIRENTELREKIYQVLSKLLILQYKTPQYNDDRQVEIVSVQDDKKDEKKK